MSSSGGRSPARVASTAPARRCSTRTAAAWRSPTRSGSRRARKPEADPRADGRVLEPDPAAVRLDDRAGDREAEAGAAVAPRRVGAVEGVEDALAVLGGEAVPGVGDLDFDRAGHRLGADGHAAVRWCVADRVLDQVEEHALELLGVGASR